MEIRVIIIISQGNVYHGFIRRDSLPPLMILTQNLRIIHIQHRYHNIFTFQSLF